MRLISLSLRGFIGTYTNLGLDEVFIDFSKFDAGLIAFVGGNGLGKSTILENLTPFRRMVSRTPPHLQYHVRLRDSHRILRFEMGGHEYECKMLIDAQTGKQEAYLMCDGEALSDGKVKTYDEAVTRIFGSEDLFFRSLFRAQNAPSFNDMTEAKLKALFAELLGQNIYELYEERAKVYRNQRQVDLEKIRSRIEALQLQSEDVTALVAEADGIRKDIAAVELALVAAREVLTESRTAAHAAEIALAALQPKIERRAELTEKVISFQQAADRQAAENSGLAARHAAELQPLSERITKLERIVANKALIGEKVAQLTRLRTELPAHQTGAEAYQAAVATKQEAQRALNSAKSETDWTISTARATAQSMRNAWQRACDRHQGALDAAKTEIAAAERTGALMQDVPCNGMDIADKCKLLANARASRDSLEDLRAKLTTLETVDVRATDEAHAMFVADTDLENTESEAKGKLQVLQLNVDYADEDIGRCDYDAEAHQGVLTQIQQLERDRWETLQTEAQTAEITLADARADMEVMTARHADETERMKQLEAGARAQVDQARAEVSTLEAEIAGAGALRARLQEAQERTRTSDVAVADGEERLRNLQATIARQDERIAAAERAQEEITRLEGEEKAVRAEYEEWLFVTTACGKNGILPLELDAAGPRVSSIANELLTGFGNGYQVEITTQRLKADGDMGEGFDILVRREGNGDTVPLGMLSGGERVWIEAALMLAIGIYLRQQSTYDIQTTFMDEADGALSSERAHQYMDMVRACHRVAGIHHTIIITHRQELLAFIPQQICLSPGKIEILN